MIYLRSAGVTECIGIFDAVVDAGARKQHTVVSIVAVIGSTRATKSTYA